MKRSSDVRCVRTQIQGYCVESEDYGTGWLFASSPWEAAELFLVGVLKDDKVECDRLRRLAKEDPLAMFDVRVCTNDEEEEENEEFDLDWVAVPLENVLARLLRTDVVNGDAYVAHSRQDNDVFPKLIHPDVINGDAVVLGLHTVTNATVRMDIRIPADDAAECLPEWLVIDADTTPDIATASWAHRIAAATAEDAARDYWADQDGERRAMNVWVRPVGGTSADDAFFAFPEEVDHD